MWHRRFSRGLAVGAELVMIRSANTQPLNVIQRAFLPSRGRGREEALGRGESSLLDKKLRRDLKTLANFIRIYCDGKHAEFPKAQVRLKHRDVEAMVGFELKLCPACTRLLQHAFVKRINCPLDPKPACKNCPQHCYHPAYRARIREVMKYSGHRLLFSGRLDYLLHLIG